MEKQPHQEYRNELADKLKEIRNSDPENPEFTKGKAKGYLEAKKETPEYKNNKYIHDVEKMTSDKRKKIEEITPDADIFMKKLESFNDEDVEFLGYDFVSEQGDDVSLRVKVDLSTNYLMSHGGVPRGIKESFEWSIHTNVFGRGNVDFVNNFIPEKLKILKEIIFVSDSNTDLGCIYYKKQKGLWWNSHIDRQHQLAAMGAAGLSSLRFKEELQPIDDTIEKINKLRGVSFKWKSSEDSPREIGVIAEEVAEVFPELVFLDTKGKPLGVHYDKFVAVLIEAVKDLDKRIKELEK